MDDSTDTDLEESLVENTPEKERHFILKTKLTKNPASLKLEPLKYSADVENVANTESLNQDFQTQENLLNGLIKECDKILLDEAENVSYSPTFTKMPWRIPKSEYHPLAEPIFNTYSKNQHSMHVFYTIEEVLRFSPKNSPKNCNIQLAGIVRYYVSLKSFFLDPIGKENLLNHNTSNCIKITLKDCLSKPLEENNIIAFGVLAFDDKSPFIIVRFFQPLEIPYFRFEHIMLLLRTTVPLENMEKTNETGYFPQSILESEEVDFLAKTFIDSDESIKESDSYTFSNDTQFNDSYWNEVLKDLSFGKVFSETSNK